MALVTGKLKVGRAFGKTRMTAKGRGVDSELHQKPIRLCQMSIGNEIISSTKIRQELKRGNVEKVSKMLSRPYLLTGKVIHGKKLGRTIGFPTVNMDFDSNKIIPDKGVYYTNIEIDGKKFKGITSVGNNPTVNGQNLTIETHVLNFNKDIYGEEVTLYFISKMREEIKFNSISELKEQLKKDRDYAINNSCILNQNFI